MLWKSSLRLTVGALAASLFLAGPASAQDPKPVEISNVIRAGAPYGEGTLTWFIFTPYDASLWTDAAQWSMQSPFALSLTYRDAFSGNDIADRAIEEMGKVNPGLSRETLASYRALMARFFPDVKAGDELTALYTPGGIVKFFRDGQPTGEVHDATFAGNFFAIWFSPATSAPGLREKLLRLNA